MGPQLLGWRRFWRSTWNLVDVMIFAVFCWMGLSFLAFQREHAVVENRLPSWELSSFMLTEVRE
jgi:hypothetical protein